MDSLKQHIFVEVIQQTMREVENFAKKPNCPLKVTSADTVCAAAAMCMKRYNQQLSALHYRNGLMLLHGGLKALALDRCFHLGFST